MTIQELASNYLSYFVRLTRDNGDVVWVWNSDNEVPPELKELSLAAHDGMMPEDYKYDFIVDALMLIADSSEDDDLYGLADRIESDVYNSDLINWLSSNLSRAYYVNQYVEEWYSPTIPTKDFDLYSLISGGQLEEKREVFYIVLNSLTELIENLEDDIEIADDLE